MRISDWSSDVCSSDLFKVDIEPSTKNWMRRQDMLSIAENAILGGMTSDGEFCSIQADMHLCGDCTAVADAIRHDEEEYQPTADEITRRSAERRGGTACVSTCRSRWSRSHYKKKKQK